jgi:hypothetical protein
MMCAGVASPARVDAILAEVRALYRLACRLEDMDELNHRDGANYDDPELQAAIRSIYRKITSMERKLPRHYRLD